MASTHRVLIESVVNAQTFLDRMAPLSSKRQMVQNMAAYLDSVAAGVRQGKLRFMLKGTAASNAITLATFVSTNTVTVNGVVLTGNTDFTVGASDEVTANNLATVINASTTAGIVGDVTAQRKGTFTFSGMVTTDTVTVNGVVFTAKTTPSTSIPEEFQVVVGNNTKTALNFANAVKKSQSGNLASIVSCTPSSAVVTIITSTTLTGAASAHCTAATKIIVLNATQPGVIGNLMTLAISANGSVTGANFAGGLNGSLYTYTKI